MPSSSDHTRSRKLLEEVGPAVVGQRLRRLRESQGLSIRSLAEKASVSKNSVVRLEQGGGTQSGTLVKVCTALGFHIDRLLENKDRDAVTAAAHHHDQDRWYDHGDMGSEPLLGATGPLTKKERAKAVKLGAQTPVKLLQSRLPGGRVMPSLLEVYEPTEPRSHIGEEFAYVLEGKAIITVAGEEHTLEAGEALTFWSAEPHSYAPADSRRVPVRILSVRIEG